MRRQNGPRDAASRRPDTRPESYRTQEDPVSIFKGGRQPPRNNRSENKAAGPVPDHNVNLTSSHPQPRRHPRRFNNEQQQFNSTATRHGQSSYPKEPYSLDSMPSSSQPYPQNSNLPGLNVWGQQQQNPADAMNLNPFNFLSAMNSMSAFNAVNNGGFQQPYLQQQEQQNALQNFPLVPPASDPYAFGAFTAPPLWNNNLSNPFNLPFLPTAAGLMNFTPSAPAFANNAFDGLYAQQPGAAPSATAASFGGMNMRQPQKKAPSPPRQLERIKPPVPTDEYMAQSSMPPKEIPSPQPLLVILDLNGTLIYRKHRRLPPQFAKRAGLDKFLKTLMVKYTVMIWSSSQPPTVDAVCQKLFPEDQRKALVAEWGRDRFGLTRAQYKERIQVYKRLEIVWADEGIQATFPGHRRDESTKPPHVQVDGTSKQQWDQSNTILIDDSKLKALSQPYNILEIPEFTNAPDVDESRVFPMVLEKLDALARHDDVSKLLRQWSLTRQDIIAPSRIVKGDEQNESTNSNSNPNSNSTYESNNSQPETSTTAPANPAAAPATTTKTKTKAKAKAKSTLPQSTDVAEARKERRKARKQKRTAEKAARREAAAAAVVNKKEKLNARKQKKKEKKKNAAAATAVTVQPVVESEIDTEEDGGVHINHNNMPVQSYHHPAIPSSSTTSSSSPPSNSASTQRSPSPVSSVGEEGNHLLDRLEESLGLTNR